MATNDLSWTDAAHELEGQGFERFHFELARYNARQLMPAFPTETWRDEVKEFAQVSWAEGERIAIYVGEHEIGACCNRFRRNYATCAAASTDIDKPESFARP